MKLLTIRETSLGQRALQNQIWLSGRESFFFVDVVVDTDEEYKKVNFDKLPSLRAVFQKDGEI